MLKESTINHQRALADYCRKGEGDVPEAKEDRIGTYRRLVFNVSLDILSNAYPIAKGVLGDDHWRSFIHQFFQEHDCRSYQVMRMPRELIDYVETLEEVEGVENMNAFKDLLLFEWMELSVYVMPDYKGGIPNAKELSFNAVPVFHDEYMLEHFRYPVHQKSLSEITKEDQSDYFVMCYRNREDGSVHYTELTPLMTAFITAWVEEGQSIEDSVQNILGELDDSNLEQTYNHLEKALKGFQEKGLLLGYK